MNCLHNSKWQNRVSRFQKCKLRVGKNSITHWAANYGPTLHTPRRYYNRLSSQHFYEERVQKYLDRKPQPVTVSQLVHFGKDLSLGRVLTAGRYVSQELCTRFAHRIRQMQLMPYRIMGEPSLLRKYEQYVDSLVLLDGLPKIKSMASNMQLLDVCRQVLQIHHGGVAETVFNARQILGYSHKPEDTGLLDNLIRSMITSRLSRLVLTEQQSLLTECWQAGKNIPNHVGTVKLNCTMLEALTEAEATSRSFLAQDAPRIEIEGAEDALSTPFPYVWSHLLFPLGHILLNSMEACIRNGVQTPIKVTVGGTKETIHVRISDRGKGLRMQPEDNVWSFLRTSESPCSGSHLSTNPFYSPLYQDEARSYSGHHSASRAHLNLGLPLSKIYVDYWGGALELCSIEGFGCDALIRISTTGGVHEKLLL